MNDFIQPDWPAPCHVKAFSTTRVGGVSANQYSSFNLAQHVNDCADKVSENRLQLIHDLKLPSEPLWLEQVHGNRVLDIDVTLNTSRSRDENKPFQADACFTAKSRYICVVMTADCLPVLICNRQGNKVAAVHAGWRGLQMGVIENTIDAMQLLPEDTLLWFGPAIGAQNFEVGAEVRQLFVDEIRQTEAAFRANREGHYLLDIYQLARIRLQQKGINQIYGGGLCTYAEASRFYSYRRDGETGRMASLIWREL